MSAPLVGERPDQSATCRAEGARSCSPSIAECEGALAAERGSSSGQVVGNPFASSPRRARSTTHRRRVNRGGRAPKPQYRRQSQHRDHRNRRQQGTRCTWPLPSERRTRKPAPWRERANAATARKRRVEERARLQPRLGGSVPGRGRPTGNSRARPAATIDSVLTRLSNYFRRSPAKTRPMPRTSHRLRVGWLHPPPGSRGCLPGCHFGQV